MTKLVKRGFIIGCFAPILVVLALPLAAQEKPVPSDHPVHSVCPLDVLKFDASGINVRVRNVSGKTIVGIAFNAALADATEHWTWVHWDLDQNRPLREFGWNKALRPGDTKTLSWNGPNLDFRHGGGGAFVLTSVLFDDGSNWEEPINRASCKIIWYNGHRKSFQAD